jgi:hypothetical protein
MSNLIKALPPLFFLILAIIFAFIFTADYHFAANFWRWLLFFNVGIQGVWAWYGQTFHSKEIAKSIGWQDSPFLFEVACANLGAGVAGLLAPWMNISYWIALSLANGIFLWGAGYGHIREMVKNKNFAINNCGPIFFTDVLVPLLFLILYLVVTFKR